jgi:hypothetical protein
VSTTGVSPLTVIVSASVPTRISVLIAITPDPVTSTPSRFMLLNPASMKVSV